MFHLLLYPKLVNRKRKRITFVKKHSESFIAVSTGEKLICRNCVNENNIDAYAPGRTSCLSSCLKASAGAYVRKRSADDISINSFHGLGNLSLIALALVKKERPTSPTDHRIPQFIAF